MKNYIYFLVMAIVLLSTSACKKEHEALFLSTEVSNLEMPKEGGSITVPITCNTSWKVVITDAEWCTLGSATMDEGDGEFRLNVSPNSNAQSRTVVVTIKAAGTEPITVELKQSGVSSEVTVDKSSIEAGALTGVYPFKITSNGEWTITSDADWVSLDREEGTGNADIAVKASRNPTLVARVATLTVATKDESRTIVLTQAASNELVLLAVDREEILTSGLSEKHEIEVTSYGTWTVGSISSPWLSVDKKDNKVEVTVSEYTGISTNARNATFVLSATGTNNDSKAITITVSQSAGFKVGNVTWAISNLAERGVFAESSTSPGLFYQWNNAAPWSRATQGSWYLGRHIDAQTTVWPASNNPCPAGWRLPTRAEFSALRHAAPPIWSGFEESNPNPQVHSGMTFAHKLFFPAAGCLIAWNGQFVNNREAGYYWTQDAQTADWYTVNDFRFSFLRVVEIIESDVLWGFNCRCVKD